MEVSLSILSLSQYVSKYSRRHVFRDLRPYVCTFTKCQNAEKLYATRHEWLYHEMQMHRRKWVCNEECGEEFWSRAEMAGHIPECRRESLTDAQLQIMLDINERPMDDSEGSHCPLCSEGSMSLRRLKPHLAQHLEELSLFVINRSQEEGDDDDCSLASGLAAQAELSRDTVSTSIPGSRISNLSGEDGENISLAKSDIKKSHQPPVENFTAVANARELDSATKAKQWVADIRIPRSTSPSSAQHSTAISAEPPLPVRELSADEQYVMEAFERHADHCYQCNNPLQVDQENRTFCERGQQYAKDVSDYIYSKNGKAHSVVDRELNQPTLVRIPHDCVATHDLLLSIEDGLRIHPEERRSKPVVHDSMAPVISYDRIYPVAPKRSKPATEILEREPGKIRSRRVIVYPTPRHGSPSRGSLYDADAADRIEMVKESSRIYRRTDYTQ
ncbi:hypothetical protein BJX63DRAFT_34947 [Aspergillus granulosus]|uniref:C2H2-type domain-containing protein n=1 Tax=Aspergillus granulosus TaxID=176169 RepID=A0ABR4GZJ6_9EURO